MPHHQYVESHQRNVSVFSPMRNTSSTSVLTHREIALWSVKPTTHWPSASVCPITCQVGQIYSHKFQNHKEFANDGELNLFHAQCTIPVFLAWWGIPVIIFSCTYIMQKTSENYWMVLQLNSQICCNILFFHITHM